MAAPVVLVAATPRRVSDGVAIPVWLAGGGGILPYFYAGQQYRAGIVGQPKSVASLDFDGLQLGGGGVAQSLELRWSPGRNAGLAELSALFWNDAPITVRIGAEGTVLPPVVASGLVLDAGGDAGALRIALGSQTSELDRPLLVDRYAGTGGVEGPVEWEGQIKSRAWGRNFNVPGRALVPVSNIWCFGDPRRPWRAFTQVRVRGVAIETLTVLAWQGSAEATLAALVAIAVPAGGAVACPSIACVKWWTDPSGDLHADIEGETEGGYVDTAPAIAARIAASRSALTVDAAELAATIAVRPDPFGWRVDTESASAAGELSELLAGVSLSWLIVDGRIVFRRWEWTAPTRVARSHGVTRRTVYKPVTARKLGYRRNWSPMARGELAGIILTQDIAYEDGTPIEALKPAQPGATAGAPDGTTIGGSIQPDGTVQGGKPVGEVLATLDRIEPIAEATDLLKKANIDQDALQRQATRDVGKLDQALLRALLEANRTREVMRDAGIVVDPATGRVRIHGVDQTSERVSKVEIDLDATKGRISLLASSNYVNEQIARAQLDPTGQGALDEIITRLTSAEIELDGLDAIVRLKADSQTVTTLGGRVVSVEQELDALAGEIALKASATDVFNLDTRVKQAELKLTTVGDMSALTIAVRQARYAADDAATGSLQALLSADTQHRRQLVAAAEARQELYTRLVDGDAAEAVARQVLAAKVGDTEARVGREEGARIAGDRAQADALTVVEARIGEAARAQTTRLEKVIADGDRASSEVVQQLVVRLNGDGITIEDQIEAIAEANGRLTGTRTIAIDINGNMVGTQLLGAEDGRGSLNLINADLRMGTGRVIFNTGTFMQVQGIGFGRDRNLLEWFGPTMAIDQCTRTNATAFKTITGDAYFGGSLSAGTYRNTGAATTLQLNANIMIGPFRSNGRPRELVVSYRLIADTSITTACPTPRPPDPTVIVDLYRGMDATGVLLDSRTMTGFYDCDPGFGESERGSINEQIEASFTLTDTTAGDTFSYFARIRQRQNHANAIEQTLSIISTEE